MDKYQCSRGGLVLRGYGTIFVCMCVCGGMYSENTVGQCLFGKSLFYKECHNFEGCEQWFGGTKKFMSRG